MKRSYRFQLAINLLALIASVSVTIAEYIYDSYAAGLALVLCFIVLVTSTLSLGRSGRRLPALARWFLTAVVTLCGLGIIVVLLMGRNDSPQYRAFALGHFAMVIMSCRFISSYRTRDYSQIFILSLLLMVVAAMTTGGIILAPFFVVFALLAGYCVMLYQLQRQIEIVAATRFVGRTPSREEYHGAVQAARAYWRQLGVMRFHLSAGVILLVALALALGVFFGFPRLETGSLLGNNLSDSSLSGFSEVVRFGQVDRNQTLRQIVARVTLLHNETPLTGQDGPFYFRSVTMDRFRLGNELTEEDTWLRSFPVYLSNERKACAPIKNSPDVITQQVLLSGYQSSLMPGLYPIVAVEGLPEPKYNYYDLDSTVSATTVQPRATWQYQAASLVAITPEQAKQRFFKHVRHLGQLWQFYATDRGFDQDPIGKMAREIVGDLASERELRQRDADKAFQLWQGRIDGGVFVRPGDDESSMILSEVWTRKVTPPDAKELERLEQLYTANANLADIDRLIMQQIVRWLQSHYSYSVSPPPINWDEWYDQADEDDVYHPILEFLKKPGSEGNCEYFASAAAMLARSLGLRVRLAGGYLAWEYIAENDYFIVRQSDAHVWTELYTVTHDWMTFDPTPPTELPSNAASPGRFKAWMNSLSARLEQWQVRWLRYSAQQQEDAGMGWADAVTGWMAKLERDSSDPPGRFRRGLLSWFTHNPDESYFALFMRWMMFFLTLIDLGIGVRELMAWLIPKYTHWRAYRRYLECYDDDKIAFYPQMLQLLQNIHIHKPAAMTPREFALRVMGFDEEAFAPVGQLSEAYYRVRFGGMTLDETRQRFIEDALQRLGLVVKSLRNTVKRPWPWENQGHA